MKVPLPYKYENLLTANNGKLNAVGTDIALSGMEPQIDIESFNDVLEDNVSQVR